MRFSLAASLVGVVIAVTLTSVVHSEDGETSPGAVRPGTCPMMIQGCPDDQPRDKTECTSDSGCPLPLKCCNTPCGGAGCMQPDDLPKPQPTYCPDYRAIRIACDGTRVIERCIDNQDCTGGKICCRSPCGGTECFVGGTQKPETRPGECETVNWAALQCMRMSDEARQIECTRDTDCEGAKKCCDNPCTSQRCRDPPRNGTCPDYTGILAKCSANVPADECWSDSQCEIPTQKCCKRMCGGKACLDPQEGKAYKSDDQDDDNDDQGDNDDVKQTGYCPDYRTMLVQNCDGKRETCIDNDSCTGGKLCCRSPCGGFECMEQTDTPPQTKNGTCAYVPWELIDCAPMDEERRQTECTQDFDCDGELKCCENACSNKRCKPRSEKPGLCEDFSNIRALCIQGAWENSTAECVDDQGCEGNEKCCQQLCIKPLCKAPLVHPGQCPAGPVPSGSAGSGSGSVSSPRSDAPLCTFECTNTSQCGNGTKCCKAGFSGTMCWNTYGTDQCPVYSPPAPGTIINCTIRCTNDVDCGADSICCQTSSNTTQCIKKGQSGQYSCPRVMPPPPNTCPHTCDSDAPCASNEKCCKNDCGGTQCYPVQVVCPYWDPNRACLVPNPQECKIGSLCDDGSQCCQYECSGTRCQRAMCPASNPAIKCIMANPKTCNASDHCGTDGICCEYECSGRKCIKQEHPGTCPNTTETIGSCAIACLGDHSCADSQKCCRTGCGGTNCMPTVESGNNGGSGVVGPNPPERQTPAPPVCPVFDPKATCGGSGDKRKPHTCDPAQKCSNGGKCCQYECEGTRCETDLCPAPNGSSLCSAQKLRECEKSTDCGEDKKCCETHCGGTSCFPRETKQDNGKGDEGNTQPPKQIDQAAPGTLVCPNNPSIRCTPALQKRSCTGDSQCGNKKCCDTGCDALKICQTPVRQGNCPVINVRCAQATLSDAVNQCGTDMGCEGNQKCCNHPCPGFGTRCFEPVA